MSNTPSGRRRIKTRSYNGSGKRVKANTEDIFVLKADEYDLVPHTANRMSTGIVAHHLESLKKSMEERGFNRKYPIIVNENMEICEGHHRFHSAKELGIDLYYKIVKGATIEEFAKMSSVVKKWSSIDWITYWSKKGDRNSMIIQWLMNEYGLNISIAIPLAEGGSLRNRPSVVDRCRDRLFKIKSADTAKKKAICLKQVRDFLPKAVANKTSFQSAWVILSSHDRYEHSHMMNKVKKNSGMLREQPNLQYHLEQLLTVYNYNTRVKDRIQLAELQ